MLPDPIFPPRPASKIGWEHLPRYEASHQWGVQRKFNGKHVTICVLPGEGEVGIWGRDTNPLVRFQPPASLKSQFLSLNLTERIYWFAGELMHQKTTDPHYQGKVVLFDILQAGRMFIGGPTQEERLSILSSVCRNPQQLEPGHGIALQVTKDVWLAQWFTDHFMDHFKEMIELKEIEGVVLRQRGSVLRNFGNKYYEVPWLIRVRKPHKNYNL